MALAEFGVVGGNDEVAHHRQLAAAAQRKAADGGNHGLANAADGFPVAGDEVALVGINKAQLLHGRNVRASGKGALAAGEDDAAHFVIGVKRLERQPQLVHQLVIERVELLRAVEGDDANALIAFGAGLNQFIRHGLFSLCGGLVDNGRAL